VLSTVKTTEIPSRKRMQSFERMKGKYVHTCRHRLRCIAKQTNKTQQIYLVESVLAGPHAKL